MSVCADLNTHEPLQKTRSRSYSANSPTSACNRTQIAPLMRKLPKPADSHRKSWHCAYLNCLARAESSSHSAKPRKEPDKRARTPSWCAADKPEPPVSRSKALLQLTASTNHFSRMRNVLCVPVRS